MKLIFASIMAGGVLLTALVQAQDSAPATSIKTLKDRTERGTLSDRSEVVRGDTGKWNDAASLQHAPSLERKPQSMSIDDWIDQLAEKKAATTASDDNWLIFRSRQLDDNDRVWVEKIERRGNEFAVVMSEAVWKGNYFKTFTYYEVLAINLGKLPPGDYTVKWIIKPLTFKQLEKPAQPNRDNKDNWPQDEQPAQSKPVEVHVPFSVQPSSAH